MKADSLLWQEESGEDLNIQDWAGSDPGGWGMEKDLTWLQTVREYTTGTTDMMVGIRYGVQEI
jgi:hypothetical protein